MVGFIIEKDGSMSDIKVVKGIGGGCDEEAVRVTKLMGKWNPGMQKGKPVRVRMVMPYQFKLK
ncbi:MAG TPA: energy transducer TonB [Ignavibacteriales bacterium]|nr:energy transducer TonB [Ignavibacteriales bacterium]